MELCGLHSEQARSHERKGVAARRADAGGRARSRRWIAASCRRSAGQPRGSWQGLAPAAQTACPAVCSFMGYDDLNVVDPTTGEAKAAQADMNDTNDVRPPAAPPATARRPPATARTALGPAPYGASPIPSGAARHRRPLTHSMICIAFSAPAATRQGLHQLQGLPWEGHHVPGHPACLDHAALHHAAGLAGWLTGAMWLSRCCCCCVCCCWYWRGSLLHTAVAGDDVGAVHG